MELSQGRSPVRDGVLLGKHEFGHGAPGDSIGTEERIVSESAAPTRLATDAALTRAVSYRLGPVRVEKDDDTAEPRRALRWGRSWLSRAMCPHRTQEN